MVLQLKKWSSYLFLSLIIGVVTGVIDMIFGRVLLAIGDYRDQHISVLLPFLALAGLVSVWLYQRFGGESQKGMGLLFETGQRKREKIPVILIPLVMISTWLTHLFGGSAGREGVAVQIGASLSHWVGRRLPYQDASRIFLVAGMAAGFAGLFQTPLAATFFALEVLVVGQLAVESLLPALIASLSASFTSHSLGLEKFSVFLSFHLKETPMLWLKLALLGLCFGLVGRAFAFSLAWSKKLVSQRLSNPYHRILLISIVLSILLYALWQGRYAGLGTNLIGFSFETQQVYLWDWLVKLVLTVLTLSAGFQGGEVTPLFAIGATLGVVLAGFWGLPVMLVAALGYAVVFGSATNTLLAPIFIGGEVFGFANLPYFILVAAVAYSLGHKTSIYSLQKR